MKKIECVTKENQAKGQVELSDAIFGAEANVALLHQVVRMQLAKRRQGTASTKTRADVSGGGKKPWKQKGSGRARAGSNRSPLWVGGGTVFGPHPRSYDFHMPKKMQKNALINALSVKANEDKLVLVDNLDLTEPKTKQMVACFSNLGLTGKKVLILESKKNDVLLKSIRNIPGVDLLLVDGLNVYDLMWHEKVLVTQAALDKIVERLG